MEKKTKPTQRAVSVNEVVAGIYGTCPHCGDLCHLKPNLYRNRPQLKFQIEQLGERGQYWVDWHDYIVDRRIVGTCNGSNAVPNRLVKEEQTSKEVSQ
jgi:hypothetical protein